LTPTPHASLAVVVLAHGDPDHVHRLVEALDPFPVFLHCDVRTPDDVFGAMTAGLPSRVRVLPRQRTGWARWENVAAEIEGYRAALAETDASHVALMTGSDYPLAGADELRDLLARHAGRSIVLFHALPHPNWGQNGGFSRLRYRHWAWRKHMIRLPVARALPADVVLAGGSQLKLLARAHVEAVVRAYDEEPGLVAFWRRSWVADETFVPSILSSPRFVPNWASEHVATSLWWIGWDGKRRKSPPWLTEEHADWVLARQTHPDQPLPHMFARKFSTALSGPLLDRIDAAFGLRGAVRDVSHSRSPTRDGADG